MEYDYITRAGMDDLVAHLNVARREGWAPHTVVRKPNGYYECLIHRPRPVVHTEAVQSGVEDAMQSEFGT